MDFKFCERRGVSEKRVRLVFELKCNDKFDLVFFLRLRFLFGTASHRLVHFSVIIVNGNEKK